MLPAARMTDQHVCPSHGGGPILPVCCPTVLIGYMPAARITDTATCCAAPDAIAKGSTTVLIGYLPAARITDPMAHGGAITTGEFTVLIGG